MQPLFIRPPNDSGTKVLTNNTSDLFNWRSLSSVYSNNITTSDNNSSNNSSKNLLSLYFWKYAGIPKRRLRKWTVTYALLKATTTIFYHFYS